jgi:lipoprotein Spr
MLEKFLFGLFFVVLSFSSFANVECCPAECHIDDAPIKKKSAEGLIKDSYLKLADDIQRYSKRFIGTRYLRGGKATKGFDCSGFVIYVFAKFGLKLGACSTELAKLGYDVSPKTALPGDLVFFKRGVSSKSGISHVGIVIESNETGLKFIHSASSKGVTISYLHEKYYTNHFVGVRRVIDSFKEF